MPLIHRVDYEASSEQTQELACECLKMYVEHQLEVPFPGVLVYHFSRPDPEKRPLFMQYFEVYKDDEVFFKHTNDPEHKCAKAFSKAFQPGNWSNRSWYCCGDFDNAEQMYVLKGMGCEFPDSRLAGFFVNPSFTSSDAEDASSFMYVRFVCELESGVSEMGLKNPSANVPKAAEIFEALAQGSNSGMLTFFAHTPEQKNFPDRVEVLLVASNDGTGLFFDQNKETWTKLKELCSKITCDVYGTVTDECMEQLKSTASSVKQCNTDIGYVLHPQAKDAFKVQEGV